MNFFKKYLIVLLVATSIVVGGVEIAKAITCTNNFPTSLNNYVSGNCIPSAWSNALEAKIGVNSSAVTSSLDYIVNHLGVSNFSSANISQWTNNAGYITAAAGTTTIITNGGTITGPAFTLTTSTASNGFTFTSPGSGALRLTIPSNLGFFTNDLGFITAAPATSTYIVNGGTINGPALTITTSTVSGKFTISSPGAGQILFTIPPASDYLASSTVYGTSNVSTSSANSWSQLQTFSAGISGNVSSTNINATGYVQGTIEDSTSVSYINAHDVASSSLSFNVQNATTTGGQNEALAYASAPFTLNKVFCYTSNVTTTFSIYLRANLAQTTSSAIALSSITCGTAGQSTTSFGSSTIPAGDWIVAVTTSTTGGSASSSFLFLNLQKT